MFDDLKRVLVCSAISLLVIPPVLARYVHMLFNVMLNLRNRSALAVNC